MRRPIVSAVGVLATIVVLGASWWYLAPPQLGGKTSYAVTFGISMEPHFHHGDLVVLRRRSTYSVGEVVAYYSHDLRKNVLHRIIAIHDDRYTFKGDNNNFVDPEHPTAADLVGSEWMHVPRAGDWLGALHDPVDAAIAAGVAVLLLVLSGGGGAAHHRRRQGRAPRREDDERSKRRARPRPDASLGFTVAALGAGAVVAAAAIGAFAFTEPLHRSLVWANLYVQHGAFGYSAPVQAGATYQRSPLASGEPVFVRLVHRLPVSFRYRLEATEPGRVAGTLAFDAVLRDDGGWRYAIPLAPARQFTGTAAVARGVLDLERLHQVIAAFEQETGEHNTLYHVSLNARVRVRGTVAARPLATTFTPSLALNLDQVRLTVAAGSGFRHAQGGAGTRVETTTLHAFGRTITVARARGIATLLGITGLVLAAVGGVLMLLGGRDAEVAAIRRRYEDWIVDVVPAERPDGAERRVASMDALARLAEQYDRLILHEHRDDGDAFLVEDGGIVFTYAVAAR
ncbi:MAG TPA: signal peptidase I [Gaiellaceae bacterium]|jgi:signal peptidase I